MAKNVSWSCRHRISSKLAIGRVNFRMLAKMAFLASGLKLTKMTFGLFEMKYWQQIIFEAFQVEKFMKMYKITKNVSWSCRHRISAKLAIGRVSFRMLAKMALFGFRVKIDKNDVWDWLEWKIGKKWILKLFELKYLGNVQNGGKSISG